MSYKFGLIFSTIFVALFMIFGVDMISLQFIYSDLDAKAITIGYIIAKSGYIGDSLVEQIENKYEVTFTCLSNCTPKFGDVVEYKIGCPFDPLVIFEGSKMIEITRSTVIGYYD